MDRRLLPLFFALLFTLIIPHIAVAEEMPVAVDTPLVHFDDQADTLRQAQKWLITLGCLAGGADGIYGPRTEAALCDFQAANGLPVTGHLDEETLARLTELGAGAASTADIQQRLIDLGYLQGSADGIWGARSRAAMEAFQQLNGLPVTGEAESSDALFSSDAVRLPAGLSSGSRGDDVAALQQRLIQLGFLAGKADGAYGRQTANAVAAFQRHLNGQGHSVTADGEATPLTLFHLYRDDYSSYISDVSLGATGGEAKRVETRLSSLGYMDVAADETFDAYAVEALTLFQARAGLPADGVADEATVAVLFSADAPIAERCVLHDISAGDRGLVVRYVEEALLTGGMAAMLPGGRYDGDVETALTRLYEYLQTTAPDAAELFADNSHLSVEAVSRLLDGLLVANGMEAEAEIKRVQRRLHSLYYLSKYGVDGIIGEGTHTAIREFQAENGLAETGEADPETLSRLFSASAIAKPYPYRVEVSIADQTVTVYQLNEGGDYEPAQSFSCSTGLHNSTPRGIFLDGGPGNRWHYFKKFDCWAQYSFDIEGNILFHSVLFSDKDERTLRHGSVYALGSPASHGCIRLSVKNAKWLFEHCARGSLVILIY